MIVSFDYFNTLEPPQLTLCNPHCRHEESGELTAAIGVIINPTDLEVVDNFNELSELSFTVTKGAGTNNEVYRSLANRRTVFAEGLGFFVINSVEEHESDEGIYKSVSCVSAEAELENRMLPYFEDGEYTLPKVTTQIANSVTNWTFREYSSTAPKAIMKSRYFEDVETETDILSYLIDTLQDTFEVLFIFDTVNREILVYDQDNYTQMSAVQLSSQDVLESIEIKENSDDIYTCLNVVGGNDLNIMPVNPLGTNRIYNLAHYKSWMSSSLLAAVEQWEEQVDAQNIKDTDDIQLDTEISLVYDIDTWYIVYSGGQIPLSNMPDDGDYVKYPIISQLYYKLYDRQNNAEWDLDNANTLRELYDKCSKNVAAEAARGDADVAYTVTTYNAAIGAGNEITAPAVDGEKARILGILGDDTSGLIGEQKAIMDEHQETDPEYIAAKVLYDAYVQCKTNIEAADDGSGEVMQAAINECNDVVVPNNGTKLSSIAVQIQSLQDNLAGQIAEQDAKISTKSSELSNIELQTKALSDQMIAISTLLAFSNTDIFSADDRRELESYIFQATYTEENITLTDSMTNEDMFKQSLDLYTDAIDELSVICHPSQEFSVDARFFIGLADYKDIVPKIEPGRYMISVELYDGEIADLFLTAMSVNYEDGSLSFTFGNRYNKYDNRTLYGDLFGNIEKTAAAVQSLQSATYPVTHGELTALTTAIRDARNVTKTSAIAADNQSFTLDGTGYTARRDIGAGDFSPEQLKIVNNAIVITRDNWQSAVAAIGKMVIGEAVTYGINAEAIVGELIVGEQLALNVDGKDLETYLLNLQSGIVSATEYKNYMTFDPTNGLIIRQEKTDTSDNTYTFYTVQKGDGYYFYRTNDESKPFMSITSVDGKMCVNIAEITDRLSIGSEDYGGCFDFIITDAGLAVKWRELGTTSS